MVSYAHGIVGHSSVFRGIVSGNIIRITFVDEFDVAIKNVKCGIEFENKQVLQSESNTNGVVQILRKAPGKIKIKDVTKENMKEESFTIPCLRANIQLKPLALCNRYSEPNPERGLGPLGNQNSTGRARMYYEGENRIEVVKLLQKMLIYLKPELSGDETYLTEDGEFDDSTQEAVKEFQNGHTDCMGSSIREDGLVGPLTAEALNRALVGKWYDFYETPQKLLKDTLLMTLNYKAFRRGMTLDLTNVSKVKIVLLKEDMPSKQPSTIKFEVFRDTPLWEVNNSFTSHQIENIRTRLTGKLPEEGFLRGWTTAIDPNYKDKDSTEPTEKDHIHHPRLEISWSDPLSCPEDPTKFCLWIEKISLSYSIAIYLYIDTKYKPAQCPYKALYQHELKHADNYKDTADEYLAKMEEKIREKSLEEEPNEDRIPSLLNPCCKAKVDIEKFRDRVGKEVIGNIIKEFHLKCLEKIGANNNALDNPEEYKRVRAQCSEIEWG